MLLEYCGLLFDLISLKPKMIPRGLVYTIAAWFRNNVLQANNTTHTHKVVSDRISLVANQNQYFKKSQIFKFKFFKRLLISNPLLFKHGIQKVETTPNKVFTTGREVSQWISNLLFNLYEELL